MIDPFYLPHGFCLTWDPWLMGLHIFGDIGTGLAYLSIPLAIYHYMRKRPDLPYRWIAHLFVAFITLCGTGHLLDSVNLWFGLYELEGYIMTATAVVSICTAVLLWAVMPRLLRVPTVAMMQENFDNLRAEVRLRTEAEFALRDSQSSLEARVVERTRQLSEKQERLRLAVEVADLGTWDHGVEMEWSDRAKEILGLPPDWTPSLRDIRQAVHPEDRPVFRHVVRAAISAVSRSPINTDLRVVHPNGAVHWVTVQGKAIFEEIDGRQRATRLLGVMKDITDRKNWETRLQESEARFRDLADAMPQIVWVADQNGSITYMNKRWGERTAESPVEQVGYSPALHPDDEEVVQSRWRESQASLKPYDCELRLLTGESQQYHWYLSRAMPVRQTDGSIIWYGTATDIHEQKRNEAALAASVAEKETLLREVHHRVKNNLQGLWALLQLEKFAMPEGDARDRLDAVSDRISIMGNIHRQLYKSNNLAMIDFGDQLTELTSNLVQLSRVREDVSLEIAAESLLCDLDIAIPLGLIANEIATNAIKHAFPDNRRGCIRVHFRRHGPVVRLTLADDGIGDSTAGEIGSGVGSQLIEALAGQIGATVIRTVEAGTTVEIILDGGKFVDGPA